MEQWWNHIDRRKLKYLDKNLSQCHFVHHGSQMDWSGSSLRGERPATNRLSHDMAFFYKK
jgi:hypothetical protein